MAASGSEFSPEPFSSEHVHIVTQSLNQVPVGQRYYIGYTSEQVNLVTIAASSGGEQNPYGMTVLVDHVPAGRAGNSVALNRFFIRLAAGQSVPAGQYQLLVSWGGGAAGTADPFHALATQDTVPMYISSAVTVSVEWESAHHYSGADHHLVVYPTHDTPTVIVESVDGGVADVTGWQLATVSVSGGAAPYALRVIEEDDAFEDMVSCIDSSAAGDGSEWTLFVNSTHTAALAQLHRDMASSVAVVVADAAHRAGNTTISALLHVLATPTYTIEHRTDSLYVFGDVESADVGAYGIAVPRSASTGTGDQVLYTISVDDKPPIPSGQSLAQQAMGFSSESGRMLLTTSDDTCEVSFHSTEAADAVNSKPLDGAAYRVFWHEYGRKWDVVNADLTGRRAVVFNPVALRPIGGGYMDVKVSSTSPLYASATGEPAVLVSGIGLQAGAGFGSVVVTVTQAEAPAPQVTISASSALTGAFQATVSTGADRMLYEAAPQIDIHVGTDVRTRSDQLRVQAPELTLSSIPLWYLPRPVVELDITGLELDGFVPANRSGFAAVLESFLELAPGGLAAEDVPDDLRLLADSSVDPVTSKTIFYAKVANQAGVPATSFEFDTEDASPFTVAATALVEGVPKALLRLKTSDSGLRVMRSSHLTFSENWGSGMKEFANVLPVVETVDDLPEAAVFVEPTTSDVFHIKSVDQAAMSSSYRDNYTQALFAIKHDDSLSSVNTRFVVLQGAVDPVEVDVSKAFATVVNGTGTVREVFLKDPAAAEEGDERDAVTAARTALFGGLGSNRAEDGTSTTVYAFPVTQAHIADRDGRHTVEVPIVFRDAPVVALSETGTQTGVTKHVLEVPSADVFQDQGNLNDLQDTDWNVVAYEVPRANEATVEVGVLAAAVNGALVPGALGWSFSATEKTIVSSNGKFGFAGVTDSSDAATTAATINVCLRANTASHDDWTVPTIYWLEAGNKLVGGGSTLPTRATGSGSWAKKVARFNPVELHRYGADVDQDASYPAYPEGQNTFSGSNGHLPVRTIGGQAVCLLGDDTFNQYIYTRVSVRYGYKAVQYRLRYDTSGWATRSTFAADLPSGVDPTTWESTYESKQLNDQTYTWADGSPEYAGIERGRTIMLPEPPAGDTQMYDFGRVYSEARQLFLAESAQHVVELDTKLRFGVFPRLRLLANSQPTNVFVEYSASSLVGKELVPRSVMFSGGVWWDESDLTMTRRLTANPAPEHNMVAVTAPTGEQDVLALHAGPRLGTTGGEDRRPGAYSMGEFNVDLTDLSVAGQQSSIFQQLNIFVVGAPSNMVARIGLRRVTGAVVAASGTSIEFVYDGGLVKPDTVDNVALQARLWKPELSVVVEGTGVDVSSTVTYDATAIAGTDDLVITHTFGSATEASTLSASVLVQPNSSHSKATAQLTAMVPAMVTPNGTWFVGKAANAKPVFKPVGHQLGYNHQVELTLLIDNAGRFGDANASVWVPAALTTSQVTLQGALADQRYLTNFKESDDGGASDDLVDEAELTAGTTPEFDADVIAFFHDLSFTGLLPDTFALRVVNVAQQAEALQVNTAAVAGLVSVKLGGGSWLEGASLICVGDDWIGSGSIMEYLSPPSGSVVVSAEEWDVETLSVQLHEPPANGTVFAVQILAGDLHTVLATLLLKARTASGVKGLDMNSIVADGPRDQSHATDGYTRVTGKQQLPTGWDNASDPQFGKLLHISASHADNLAVSLPYGEIQRSAAGRGQVAPSVAPHMLTYHFRLLRNCTSHNRLDWVDMTSHLTQHLDTPGATRHVFSDSNVTLSSASLGEESFLVATAPAVWPVEYSASQRAAAVVLGIKNLPERAILTSLAGHLEANHVPDEYNAAATQSAVKVRYRLALRVANATGVGSAHGPWIFAEFFSGRVGDSNGVARQRGEASGLVYDSPASNTGFSADLVRIFSDGELSKFAGYALVRDDSFSAESFFLRNGVKTIGQLVLDAGVPGATVYYTTRQWIDWLMGNNHVSADAVMIDASGFRDVGYTAGYWISADAEGAPQYTNNPVDEAQTEMLDEADNVHWLVIAR